MADKNLDLSKSIYELAKEHPDFVDAFASIGFADIAKPGMLRTAGRFMTIPKGAALKKLRLTDVLSKLEQQGFSIIGKEEAS